MVTARKGDNVVKVAAVLENAEANALQALKAQVTGLFRVLYQDWPDSHDVNVRLVKSF
jgi:hypothetical protein